MKKMIFVLIASFLMASCSTSLMEEKTYILEAGIVTNETAETASSMVYEQSFENFCTIRDYLYQNTIDGYDVEYDLTFEDIKSVLVQISYTEGEKAANYIKEHGHIITLCNHRDYDDVKVWISITETGLLMN